MAKTDPKVVARKKRIKRIRKKITGTSEQPRMRVFKVLSIFMPRSLMTARGIP